MTPIPLQPCCGKPDRPHHRVEYTGYAGECPLCYALAERDAYRAEAQAERDGNMALRKRFGARDDETMEAWLARLHAGVSTALGEVELALAGESNPEWGPLAQAVAALRSPRSVCNCIPRVEHPAVPDAPLEPGSCPVHPER